MDFVSVIRETIATNAQQALDMAKSFAKSGKIAPSKVAEVFMSANRPQELTQFCVECMQDNKPEEGQW